MGGTAVTVMQNERRPNDYVPCWIEDSRWGYVLDGEPPYGVWRVAEMVTAGGAWITHPDAHNDAPGARAAAVRWLDVDRAEESRTKP